MDIAVLGPLLVDGRPAFSPRDQVVLEALLISNRRALGTGQVAEALWGDTTPASWAKLIPGSIMRLRRLLGRDTIETTGQGYRLVLDGHGLDVHDFEHAVQRGHHLLLAGEADRARHVLCQALELWRGQAYAEVGDWPPGRAEAQRLDEIRREAEEAVLDASLRAGLHAEVVAEAHARVAQEPLRERRWALLALAQYLSEDQAGALRTLRSARQHLADELGVDPGDELVQLERAVLRHDSSLVAAVALEEPSPENPYPGLRPFDVGDEEYFFGREHDVTACLRRLHADGVLVVVGPSGCGKSSLVRAGVAAALGREGRPVQVLPLGEDPLTSVQATLPPARGGTLVVDQFEELLAACGEDQRDALVSGLVAHAHEGSLVLAVRADRLGDVTGHPSLARLVERGLYLLGPMGEPELAEAVEGPAREAALTVEPGLVDLLVGEVLEEPGALPLMAHALHATWDLREGRTLTVEGYRRSGGIREAVARSAEGVYQELSPEQQARLHDLLMRLVSVTSDGDAVRSWVPVRQVAPHDVTELIEVLVRARLVTVDAGAIAVAHASLARAWPRLREWLDDDVEGQRILRHLTAAADSWDDMGRPASELYRGVRLNRAIDWHRDAATVLTPTEQAFLDVSQLRALEHRSREHTAERRRRRQLMTTRGLVAGVTTLLLLAGTAGGIAKLQSDRATATAVKERARAASAVALDSRDPTVAALAGVEAVRLHDVADTRAALLGALTRWTGLLTTTVLPEAVFADGKSDDIVVGLPGQLSIRDPGSLQEASSISQDASLVRVLDRGRAAVVVNRTEVDILDLATGRTAEVVLRGEREVGALAASDDGSVVAVAQYASDDGDSTVSVWRNSRLAQVGPTAKVSDIILSPDGTRLYTYAADPVPTVVGYEVASGRRVATVVLDAERGGPLDSRPLVPLAVSPDGRSVAVGGEDVVLLDGTSLAVRRRLPNPTGWTLALTFSPDGTVLAGGSDEGTATLWDVDGARRERLGGPSEALQWLHFGGDGRTLYTFASDHRLSTWDVRGDRRVVQKVQVPEEPWVALGDLVVPAPDGEVVAVAQSTPGRQDRADTINLVTASGAKAGPLSGTYANWGVWQPPDAELLAVPGDRDIRVWDWRRGVVVVEREVGEGAIEALAYTTDGSRLVVGERAGWVYLVDAQTLRRSGPRVPVRGDLLDVLWVGRDRAIAFVHDRDGSAFVTVDVRTGRVLGTTRLSFEMTHADVSPDGRLLAIGGFEGEVGIMDLRVGRWVKDPVSEHRALVLRLDFSPDGRRLVSSGDDGLVRLWDGRSGAPLESLTLSRFGLASSAVFLPDGHTLLMAAANGTIQRWDTKLDAWVERACRRAGRNLTPSEWRSIFGPDVPARDTCRA